MPPPWLLMRALHPQPPCAALHHGCMHAGRSTRPQHISAASPLTSSTARFFTSCSIHLYWRTASAVPWNHTFSVGVCVADSTSTNPSPPKRTPAPRDGWAVCGWVCAASWLRFRAPAQQQRARSWSGTYACVPGGPAQLPLCLVAHARCSPGSNTHPHPTRTRPHVVRAPQVPVERGGVELGEHIDLGDARVDAVGHGHVDEAVRAADGDGGLGARLGEREQAGSGAATQDDGCVRARIVVVSGYG